ncbi:matrixin family metalloprotease [Paenibacillus sp. Leaf72]|uniref:matrixin family metalloprotease n=1 Tax=Paenibacillus sp. Leaf72 TaxID=1736234 RepID=UPI0007C825CA|nr:matrixin family metalloprotease [Paenibacillus sp. Leaf72]
MNLTLMHCVEKKLSEDQMIDSARLAILENPENASKNSNEVENLEMAIEVSKKWSNGRTLRVRFMGGLPFVHEKVKQYANQWSQFANIKFSFGNDPDAEIRISFKQDGHWSYIGTDNLSIPKNEATMNFEGFNESTRESEFSRVVMHEFGHCIGISHEQSSPAANIPWDVKAVYKYYEDRGWSKPVVDHNVLAKHPAEGFAFTPHDPQSIMQYPVPNELTIGNYEIGWNTKLSDTDKRFIGQMYPLGRRSPQSDDAAYLKPDVAAAAMNSDSHSSHLDTH